MILDKKTTTVAYRCPACGTTVKSIVGAFALNAELLRLKCPCGGSDMTIEGKNGGTVRLTIPCFLCPRPHVYTVSEKIFFGRDLFAFPCSYTNVDIGFVGNASEVDRAIEESDRVLAELFDDADFEDISCHNGEPVFDDPQILDMVLFVIDELADEGEISCGCEDEGDHEVSVTDDSVIVKCKKCGKRAVIPIGSSLEANAFLHADHITLN